MFLYLEFVLFYIFLFLKIIVGFNVCCFSFLDINYVFIGYVIWILNYKIFESCIFFCEIELKCFSINFMLL